MKLSFLPGNLHLSETASGYVLTAGGTEVFRTRSERSAVVRFKQLRKEMEERYPGGDSPNPENQNHNNASGAALKKMPVAKLRSSEGPAPERAAAAMPGNSNSRRKRAGKGSSKPGIKNQKRKTTATRNATPATLQSLDRIVGELRNELERISQAIVMLESL